ncbi:MAG: hypothetical protein IKK83_04835 [Clostridia bacterium]|nr:hypothetical protein [Clostridia bacterium]
MKFEKPAKFTLVRLILIPVFMACMVYSFGLSNDAKYTWPRIIAASFFILAAVAYYIDKKLMASRPADTGYWHFLDVVADKLVIFGALISICFSDYILPGGFYRHFFFWAVAALLLRELALMGIGLTDPEMDTKRLFGESKIKGALFRFSNLALILLIVIVVLEPVLINHALFYEFRLLSLIFTVLAAALSIYSGLYCIMLYKQHLDSAGSDDGANN